MLRAAYCALSSTGHDCCEASAPARQIKLRRKLGDAITEAHRAEWQWNALKEEAFTREDIMRQTKGYTNAEGCCGKLCNKLRWWWLRWLKSLALRCACQQLARTRTRIHA